jgi:hypothetical protein
VTFLVHVLVFFHLIGLAGVLGGFLLQIATPVRRVLPLQWHSILTQVVTGILLAGAVPAAEGDALMSGFYAKIGVKLVLALIALWLIAVNRKRDTVSNRVWATIGGIELVNMAIALLWT